MKEDIGGALQSEDQGANGLQNTKGSDALVVVLVVKLAIISNLALLLEKLAHDSHVGISELLAEGDSEGGELGSEDLDKILHNVGESIDIGFVGKLEQLLHNGGDVLLHARSDDIVADKRLEGEGGSDTNGQSRVSHAVEDVSVDGQEVVLVLEVELLKLLDGVASPRTEVTLLAREVGEHKANEEIFHLVGNGALLAQDDGSQGGNHAQGTLLGDVVLLVIGGGLVLGNDDVDELEDLKDLLPAVLGEVDEEVGGSDIRSRSLLEVVELSVEILVGLLLELLNVLLGKTEDGEDKVSNEVGQMRLQVSPHLLGSYRLVEENEGVRQAGSTEPDGLGNPLLNLLEVVLEDLGSDVGNEVLGELEGLVTLAGARGVAVSWETSVTQQGIGERAQSYRMNRRFRLKYAHFLAFHQ